MSKLGMKRGNLIWIICALILIFLYVAATTDLIFKEKAKEVYSVSFLGGKISQDSYSNMKKGIDAATDDYNVDINFIVNSGEDSLTDRVSRIKEEVESGAKAIILEEAGEEVIGRLGNVARDIPILTLGEKRGSENVNNVYVDSGEVAEHLSKNIIKNHSPKEEVLFLISEKSSYYEDFIVEKVTESLQKEGFSCESLVWKRKERKDYSKKIILSLNREISTELLGSTDGEKIVKESSGIYGVGSSTFLLNKLDYGMIKGLVAWNDFEMGYVSIEMAVNQIKLPVGLQKEKIKSFYIDKEGLNSGGYKKILYPIN